MIREQHPPVLDAQGPWLGAGLETSPGLSPWLGLVDVIPVGRVFLEPSRSGEPDLQPAGKAFRVEEPCLFPAAVIGVGLEEKDSAVGVLTIHYGIHRAAPSQDGNHTFWPLRVVVIDRCLAPLKILTQDTGLRAEQRQQLVARAEPAIGDFLVEPRKQRVKREAQLGFSLSDLAAARRGAQIIAFARSTCRCLLNELIRIKHDGDTARA